MMQCDVKCFLFLFFSFLYGEKPIVVLTTSYNNKDWARFNIESICNQDYNNFRLIYIDDASVDNTADIVESFALAHPKKISFQLIRNAQRLGALENIYHAIHERCLDEEIIVSLDGDDWFYDNQVLKRIDAVYSLQPVWLTHGTIIEFPHNKLGWSIPIPNDIIASHAFRSYRCPSHLRTFYAWLFKKIRLADLQYKGQFFAMTWDQAMMFPMIEMAGARHAFIEEITYVYNIANPINDNKVDPVLQNELEQYIRALEPYEMIQQ